MSIAVWLAILVGVFVALYLGYRKAMAPPRLPGPLDMVVRPTPSASPASAPAAPNALLAALSRTRELFAGLFDRGRDEREALEALEEALLRADVGARTAAALIEAVKGQPDLKVALRTAMRARLDRVATPLHTGPAPQVILVVGVNGSGKTTTIGKLAGRYVSSGKTVILGAGDTFRAGAIEQLQVWGQRAGVEVIAAAEGTDPAAVAHQAAEAAKARGVDVMICDTAGRLQAQKVLMDELAKVRRVLGKIIPGAPHEVLLVLDATMGQNALSQARIFKDVAGVTGVVLTKLDGTAKGGVVIAIAEEFDLPVKLVGIGEKLDDLRDFDAAAFVDALLPV
ncbi:MAG: signal recognition particle-docking protein FtsY [Myxococcales bacterium]|nr:signal recognition particle-docking protein FtsY [Myxococcales bacterium]